MLLSLILFAPPADAAKTPAWWAQVQAEADQGGYRIIDDKQVKALLAAKPSPVLLDVRPDYEYAQAHIPGALNLEFHLGDRATLDPAKARRMAQLVGPDKNRPLIIYCRSFRCLRSGIAARWAVDMGYKQVLRYPAGWHGWLALQGQVAPDAQPGGLRAGDHFPSCRLVVLDKASDRAYLGLKHTEPSFALEDVDADFLFVELYNELCYGCLKEVASYNALFEDIANDPALKGRMKMLGLGVGSLNREVKRFRREKNVLFPLFADKGREVFHCLGEPELPVAYLIQRTGKGRWKILSMLAGHIGDTKAVLARIKAALAAAAAP
ncbi:MAG: redoxin domain-containing protein [Desulfarculus sp.]|nr:redoxin domain-containing protein [Pseudomonadota bacterium]MBV1715742.1 redoxin domain-containing protein [Desulfarculus sp.]MBU4575757.1 redoxin domain-containing protein [Pseudomonadota bacterium]MBU4597279.1 redoxin domain-containing protein [Pseudomonadota bacterium]MBV1739075.1 redoxin domain-containing protein [Desulfarculus sp.]